MDQFYFHRILSLSLTHTHTQRGSTLGINDCHFPCAGASYKNLCPFHCSSHVGFLPSKPYMEVVMDNLIPAGSSVSHVISLAFPFNFATTTFDLSGCERFCIINFLSALCFLTLLPASAHLGIFCFFNPLDLQMIFLSDNIVISAYLFIQTPSVISDSCDFLSHWETLLLGRIYPLIPSTFSLKYLVEIYRNLAPQI